MPNLKNLTIAFGPTEDKANVIQKPQLLALLKAIEDTDVTKNLSGHIRLASGSIDAAQDYALKTAGVTYHGGINPVSYSVTADKTSIMENDVITFSAVGVPLSVLTFEIENIEIVEGYISQSTVFSLCEFRGEKLYIGAAERGDAWQARITVKVGTRFAMTGEKRISFLVKGIIPITDFNVIGSISVMAYYGQPCTKTFAVSYLPTDYNVSIGNIEASCIDGRVSVTATTKNSFIIAIETDQDFSPTIVVRAGGITKHITLNVTYKIVPTITITGEDSFVAKNGVGSAHYQFAFSPANYNVPVSLISVASSNSDIVVTNSSISGFTLSTTAITADAATTITAKISVDGEETTITKTITAVYKRVYDEFTIYQNSAWIVPNSNVEVKVGNVLATYIGNGLWMVDDSLVDESMDITAGGVVLGKYGKNEYSDGSEIGEEIQTSLATNIKLPVGSIITYYFINRRSQSSDTINIKDGQNIIVSKYMANSVTNEYGKVNNYKVIDGWISESHGYGSSDVRFYVKYKPNLKSPLSPDLSITATSLIAKNGTLNNLITPSFPNGGNIAITSVSSSNAAISASLVDGKLKLTGRIEDGAPQTSDITIYYTVNGYSHTVTITVIATYEEVVVPFIIHNPTSSAITFNILSQEREIVTQQAIVNDYVVGRSETYNFEAVDMQTTTYAVGATTPITLNAGQSLFITARTQTQWGSASTTVSKRNGFDIQTEGLEFDGDILFLLSGRELTYYAFRLLFCRCNGITQVPKMDAVCEGNYALAGMFYQCANLVDASNINILKTSDMCCSEMFRNCSSLLVTPSLSATTMSTGCYQTMFYGCTSLETAMEELPAVTIANNCYYNMFAECSKLTAAPVLSFGGNLLQYAYGNMFYNCKSLTYIKAMFTNYIGSMTTGSWVRGVSSTGTFVMNERAVWSEESNRGIDGIPEGWTVLTATN